MKAKYRCVVFDHDDTVVKTTETIHYPSFLQTLKVLRPEIQINLKDFLDKCFNPGFYNYIEKELAFTDSELDYQMTKWREYVLEHVPSVYKEMVDVMREVKQSGCIIAVVSHSIEEVIKRYYINNFGFEPHVIFGGDVPA